MTNAADNYLRRELYEWVQKDRTAFDFLQESSLDGIWYWDLEGDQTQEWLSPKFWTTLGYDPATKAHLASEWTDIIFQEDLDEAMANLDAHCANPVHPYDQEVRFRHRDGSTVWVRCRGLVLRDDAGTPVRMLGAHQDISALKEKEAELEAQAEELRRSNEKLEQFAYVASHDLRSPLRTIGGFVSLLESEVGDGLSEPGKGFIARIHSGVTRMEMLIDGLLSFARLGAEMQKVPVKPFAILNDVVELMEAELAGATLTLTMADRLPVILGVPEQLALVLQNLLQNALKYAHPERSAAIDVRAQPVEGGLEVCVVDNGIGVAERFHDAVFEMFRRLHPTDAYGGGAGVGLAMCRRVIDAHGGTITLESDGKSGSCFRIFLPEMTT